MIPVIDTAICDGCGDCVEVCPPEAIALVDGKAKIDESFCEECGECVDKCPQIAISLPVSKR